MRKDTSDTVSVIPPKIDRIGFCVDVVDPKLPTKIVTPIPDPLREMFEVKTFAYDDKYVPCNNKRMRRRPIHSETRRTAAAEMVSKGWAIVKDLFSEQGALKAQDEVSRPVGEM